MEELACVTIRRIGRTRNWRIRYTDAHDGHRDHPPNTILQFSDDSCFVADLYWPHSFGGLANTPLRFNYEQDWLLLQGLFLRQFDPTGDDFSFVAPLHDREALLADFAKVQNLAYYLSPRNWRPLVGQDSPDWHRIREFQWFLDLKQLIFFCFRESGHEDGVSFYYPEKILQLFVDNLWDEAINPKRRAQGKPANPPPKVRRFECTHLSMFDDN